ncbi:hypothetical protein MD484_g2469, partial [Candolleomyces efflorescens]
MGLVGASPHIPAEQPGVLPSKRAIECDDDPGADRGAKKVKRSHAHRKELRSKQIQKDGHLPSPKKLGAVVEQAASFVLDTPIVLEDLPSSSCGYRAKAPERKPSKPLVHDLTHYLRLGFRVLKNDGSNTFPIVAGSNRIFAVVVGRPKDDPSFLDSCVEAFDAMQSSCQDEAFKPHEIHHPRGDYAVVNTGVVYGQGLQAPCNLNVGTHAAMVDGLLNNRHIRRLAIYASAAFSAWAPKVFKYYKDHIDPLFERMPHLRRIFDRSIFTSAAFNFGPNACTFAHRDCMNCPFGWCAIQSLGHFDHTLGGHLVLEELKLLLEFPIGCVVLIPSAVLTHANAAIRSGETRASFTQYCAGGLFRFVDNDYQTQAQLQASVSEEEFRVRMEQKGSRWKRGLDLYSTMEELLADAHARVEKEASQREEGQI